MAPKERRPPRVPDPSFCLRKAKAIARQNAKTLAQGGINMFYHFMPSFLVLHCIFLAISSAFVMQGTQPSLNEHADGIRGSNGVVEAYCGLEATSKSVANGVVEASLGSDLTSNSGRNEAPTGRNEAATCRDSSNALALDPDAEGIGVNADANAGSKSGIFPDKDNQLTYCPSFSLGTPIDRMLEKESKEMEKESSIDCDGVVDQEKERSSGRVSGKRPLNLSGIKDLDPELVDKVNSAGNNASEAKDDWARGRFDAWRVRNNMEIVTRIEDLPLHMLADMLEKFILCVQRQDGGKYPPDSLQNLFRTFQRILRRKQDSRIMQTRIEEKLIDIYNDVNFFRARKALEIAMQESAAAGAALPKRRKSDILSRDDQNAILAHSMHQVGSPAGLQKRFAFYCMTRFLIRGGAELRKVRDFQINVGRDFVREYIEYCETTSKNWHGGINKCRPEDFREPVRCYESDVIETWRHLHSHLPHYEVQDKIGGRFIFLQAINNPRTMIWYNLNHTSGKSISKWLREMTDVCDLEGNFTNKSCRATAITQMSVSGVPIEVAMAITGHKNKDSFKRYDQSGIVAKASAMDVLQSGGNYTDAFRCNVENLNVGLAGSSSSVKAAGLASKSDCRKPLTDMTNSGSLNVPIEIDDAYCKDLDVLLQRSPGLKHYFPDYSSIGHGSGAANVMFQGNRIDKVIIQVGNVSDAAVLANKLNSDGVEPNHNATSS